MKRIRTFGIIFILFCVIVISALPIYTLIKYGEINNILTGWIETNIRDSRDFVSFYVTILMHGDYKRQEAASDAATAGDITASNITYHVEFDRKNEWIRVSLSSSEYYIGDIRIESDDAVRPVEYFLDLGSSPVRIFIPSDGGTFLEKQVGDDSFRNILISALLPDDVNALTGLVRRFGEAGFTDGKMDCTNYIIVSSEIFSSAFSSLSNSDPDPDQIRIQYSAYPPDTPDAKVSGLVFTVTMIDEASSSGNGITRLYEYIYSALTGTAYSNIWIESGMPYHIDVIITFPADMNTASPFVLPEYCINGSCLTDTSVCIRQI